MRTDDRYGTSVAFERCDRPDCSRPASTSLSYRHEDKAVWIGALTPEDEPQHRMCGPHADRLRVPRGWDLIDLRAVAAPDEAVA